MFNNKISEIHENFGDLVGCQSKDDHKFMKLMSKADDTTFEYMKFHYKLTSRTWIGDFLHA